MLKKIILALCLIIAVFLIIVMPQNFSAAAGEKIQLCIEKVIPSLFLFSVLSNFAVNSGCIQPVIKLFNPFMKLFKLSKNCFEALFWGSFSGFPIGARIAASLYEKNKITKSEGENLLSFCNNCSPAFLVGILPQAGLKIYFIQLFCALITGLYICNKSPAATKELAKKEEHLPIAQSFTVAVKAAAAGMMNVCAFIVFTAFISEVLELLNISHPLVLGFFEITSGIAALPYITPFYFACACAIAGFGSVSVLLQAFSFASSAGLSMKKYIIGKTTNGIICFLCGYLYCTNRLYIMFSGVIIIVFLHKIGKTVFGEKHAYRQPTEKHRAYKTKNEKQSYL